MANKIGRNKAWCKNYKDSGRREINKRAKQERAEKRKERFEKRKEEGKTYVYSAEKSAKKIEAAFKDDYDMKSKEFASIKDILVRNLFAPNQGSNQTKHQEYSRRRSMERKLKDEMMARKNDAKKRAESNNRRKTAAE